MKELKSQSACPKNTEIKFVALLPNCSPSRVRAVVRAIRAMSKRFDHGIRPNSD